MYPYFILLATGLLAGVASGFLGVGGGIIVIPLLVGLLGYTQKMAQGTSLALLLPPIGILAVINYYKAGATNIKAALIMCITFIIGSYFASKYVVQLPEVTVRRIFAIFLMVYSVKLFFGK
jgi:uncharacterized membrane protein YfcA